MCSVLLLRTSRFFPAYLVDVAILNDRIRKTALGYVQHGATYAFSRCHEVREEHFKYGIDGSHQSVSRAVPSGLCANAMKELNVAGRKRKTDLNRICKSAFSVLPFTRAHINLPRSVYLAPTRESSWASNVWGTRYASRWRRSTRRHRIGETSRRKKLLRSGGRFAADARHPNTGGGVIESHTIIGTICAASHSSVKTGGADASWSFEPFLVWHRGKRLVRAEICSAHIGKYKVLRWNGTSG